MKIAQPSQHSWIWRAFTAMITERKDGVMAISFTRLLGAITFFAWLTLEILFATGVTETAPTTTMVGILASLIGIKGFKDGMKALKGRSSYASGD